MEYLLFCIPFCKVVLILSDSEILKLKQKWEVLCIQDLKTNITYITKYLCTPYFVISPFCMIS